MPLDAGPNSTAKRSHSDQRTGGRLENLLQFFLVEQRPGWALVTSSNFVGCSTQGSRYTPFGDLHRASRSEKCQEQTETETQERVSGTGTRVDTPSR